MGPHLVVLVAASVSFLVEFSVGSCDVGLPSGWSDGEDSSGVRTSAGQSLTPGANITYTCPGNKVAEEGTDTWTATCTDSGAGWYLVYGFLGSWPECRCGTRIDCRMEGAMDKATYTTRYVGTQVGGGETPGMDLKIPMPASASPTWFVKITWDMETRNEEVAVQSKTKGVIMEMLDSRGNEYSFRALNDSYLPEEVLHLDIGFVFLRKKVNEDSKKWHYPCIKEIVCKSKEEETQHGYAAILLIMVGVGAVIFLVTCCCATITWCLKRDRSYGLRPLTGTPIQVKPAL